MVLGLIPITSITCLPQALAAKVKVEALAYFWCKRLLNHWAVTLQLKRLNLEVVVLHSIYQGHTTMSDTLKILIAEDDPQIAEIQRRFVERIDGFEVIGISHSTRDAQDMLDVFNPDLVLLDIHFPDGSGLDLLKALRSGDSKTDVIMITAAKEVESLSESLRLGVFDYVLKPLVFDRLSGALNQYRSHKASLSNQASELSQQDVDQLLSRHRENRNSTLKLEALPKGIDQITLDKIIAAFKDNQDSLSAEQVGDRIGSSRTTARRYLEYLVGQERLHADINYGTVGRPERRYKVL
jgi:two-component system CitB family response regulator